MMKKNLLIATMVAGLLVVGCDKGEKEAEAPKSEEPAMVVEKTQEAEAPKSKEPAAVAEKPPEEAEKTVGGRAEIDAAVDAALSRFYKTVDGAREFTNAAKGMLVMPGVKKAAFIVGGEYGKGALRIDGKTVDYYNTVSASFGLQAGAQAKDFIIAFMTDESLLITIGAGGRLDTNTIKDSIVGMVFDVKGLMADVSLKGSKFTKLDK
jgi:lipid-binding SYLF domain-containing protein